VEKKKQVPAVVQVPAENPNTSGKVRRDIDTRFKPGNKAHLGKGRPIGQILVKTAARYLECKAPAQMVQVAQKKFPEFKVKTIMDAIVLAHIKAALEGQQWAIQMLYDRLWPAKQGQQQQQQAAPQIMLIRSETANLINAIVGEQPKGGEQS
jgi:hypothetical protein